MTSYVDLSRICQMNTLPYRFEGIPSFLSTTPDIVSPSRIANITPYIVPDNQVFRIPVFI